MDDLCAQMSEIQVSVEIVLNPDSWTEDHLDSWGIYKEIVTSGRIYKVYSYGSIFAVVGSQQIQIKNIKIEERGSDIIVVAS
jgi:hypothetical protein